MDGALTVVAVNPAATEQPPSLAFRKLRGRSSFKVCRTSASENLKAAGELTTEGGRAARRMTPLSIVTPSGTITG
jgi:hypothetical protein